MLKELELLPVARLFGLSHGKPALPETAGTPAVFPSTGELRTETARAAEAAREPSAPVPQVPEERIGAMGWDELRETVRACERCALCKQRKQAVFGVGHESAPWLFVGEGPGADEDEQGEPFVGQAGKLLDGMLAAAGLKRGREVYIANVVKCRPPGNRVPSPEEAAACAPFLDRQIDLIRPRIIVALGKTAAIRLLGPAMGAASLGSLRGRPFSYRGASLVVTYHPAYLLRNLPEKAKAWEDLLFARRTFAAAGPG
jgi:uracil-DNA glycosylase